jgi:2'-5' RNA ligase
MADTLRAFIAFRLPDPIVVFIRELQAELKRRPELRLKWVRPESIHLTLKFLGNIRPEAVDPIAAVMDETAAACPPLSLSAKGLGAFPTPKKARVVWLGLSGETHPLIGLQKELDRRLEPLGFPRETRPFKAHLTMGRAKGRVDPQALVEAITAGAESASPEFPADRLILFKSDLKPDGAVYTPLHEAPLTGRFD